MLVAQQELEKIRLHIGIHTGYLQIDRDPVRGLVGSKREEGDLKPLPTFANAIKAARSAFHYLCTPLLHDMNRITMVLEVWEDQMPRQLHSELKERIEKMEAWILEHGGRP